MLRKLAVIAAAISLSGCSNIAITTESSGSIFKSFDGGQTFVSKAVVDDKHRISADVLSFAFHPSDSQTLYVGTAASGLFKTVDGAEHWTQLNFPPTKNYGFIVDATRPDRLFASGVYNDIAKIYRSDDAGQNWKEIYTEPGSGTVITALGESPSNHDVLYAGTSAGVIIKSVNGGDTWENLTTAQGAVLKVLFEHSVTGKVMLLISGVGMLVSYDDGKTWNDFSQGKFQKALSTTASAVASAVATVSPSDIVTVESGEGVLYAGAKNGLFRSHDDGKTWESLEIIESSRKFPIRSLAVNPSDTNEIVYAAGNAFYKSIDGGQTWSTTQLDISRGVSVLRYDPTHPDLLYFALRKF
jgi:photosystem II stability/assembly factor-like uncharacterized protein